MKYDILNSIVFNYLVSKPDKRNKLYWKFLWKKFVENRKDSIVKTKVHGHSVYVNNGYMYPLFARLFKTYNNPLLELIHLTSISKERKINVIDIGAAIGDTVLLIESNCSDKIDKYFCIDGDEVFYKFLEINVLQKFKNAKGYKILLSDDASTQEKSLIRTHLGTASAQGNTFINSVSLDNLLAHEEIEEIDVIKIDVDGFDGKVIKGMVNLLSKFCPNIIFEWHPILYEKTSNSDKVPFEVLSQSGYNSFLFFTKYGTFSHLMSDFNVNEISFLSDLCMRNMHDYDWHYDVIALHINSKIDLTSLAELSFAKSVKSRY